jgi:hypothetical protein
MTFAAIVGMAILTGTCVARAQTFTWGVYRENVSNLPDDQRNCWIQAMITGEHINGELMGEQSTRQQAENLLRRDAQRGLCASQRITTSSAARGDNRDNSNWSNPNGSNGNGWNPNWPNGNGANPNWSSGNRPNRGQ